MRTVQRGTSAGCCRVRFATRSKSTAAQGEPEALAAAGPWDELPGPKPSPLLGNAWRFIPGVGNYAGLKTNQLFERLHEEYGPAVKLAGMPGSPTMILLRDPVDFEKVLRSEGQWPERRAFPSMEYYQRTYKTNRRESLATSQGKDWGDFRSAVNQVMMQPRSVREYVEPIDAVARDFVDRMRGVRGPDGQMPADFSNEMGKWAMESITYVALDTRLGALKSTDNTEALAMIQALKDAFNYINQLDFQPSLWRYVTTPALRGLIKSLDYINGVAEKYVAAAMDRLQTHPKNEARHLTVLEQLLLRNEDPAMGVAMAVDMIVAGVDTTSTGASLAMYCLANNPEKQQAVHEELDRVIPDPKEPLSIQQIEDLKYLKACIKEALRCQPVAFMNIRNTGKELVLGGYSVPKGTCVAMNSGITSTEERYFPRADKFLPERWLPQGADLKARHPFAYLPFGFGARMCVGKRFAELEMEAVLARIFRSFRLEWHQPPLQTEVQTLLQIGSPLKFTVRDRA